MSSWYNNRESQSDVVLSTRVRLARNLEGIPFPSRMTDTQKQELKEKVKHAISDSNTPFSKTLKYIDMQTIPQNEINAMVERHVISPEFAKNTDGRAIILSGDESISIMIGEEDHIRIQVILGGFQLEEAYDIAERIDTLLYSKLHFAFDSELGFLTECPTNLGTGLRASLMLHLPVIESRGEIAALGDTVSKIGFTVRGMYGEGSKAVASIYQVSNQITLGISEKNAIDNLKIIATQLIEKERSAAKELDSLKLEDMTYRALGALKYSRIITSEEAMKLLSRIKLGQSVGILKENINPVELLINCQPYMLMRKYGEMEPYERDISRAEYLREALKDY